MRVSGFLSHREGEMKFKEYEVRLFPMNSKETHLIIRAENLFKKKGAKSELCNQKS